jgi:phosphohistidine phosphatase
MTELTHRIGREKGPPAVAARMLILLRHAKSDWSGNPPDLDRPLSKRGRRQAPEAGQWLATNIEGIDLAVVSNANRARVTWELVSTTLEQPPPSRVEPRLYDADAADLLAVLHGLCDDIHTVILVGHNPGLENLATLLTDHPVRLPTAALAVIELPAAPWADVHASTGVLQGAGRPPAL